MSHVVVHNYFPKRRQHDAEPKFWKSAAGPSASKACETEAEAKEFAEKLRREGYDAKAWRSASGWMASGVKKTREAEPRVGDARPDRAVQAALEEMHTNDSTYTYVRGPGGALFTIESSESGIGRGTFKVRREGSDKVLFETEEFSNRTSSQGIERALEFIKAQRRSRDEGPRGSLSGAERRSAGRVGSEHREDEPEGVFLEPASRKYPVKVKRDGEWKYDRGLLVAAARRARMEKNESLAAKADAIRKREFGGGANDAREGSV